MLAERTTLAQFLNEERRRHPQPSGERNALILDVAHACKAIAKTAAQRALRGAGNRDEPGEEQQALDAAAHEIVLRANESGGYLAGIISDAMTTPYSIPGHSGREKLLLVFDRLEGSSNIDVNLGGGTIFSVLRAPAAVAVTAGDFLQPGARQVCAGYALYGPSTVLVISVGSGVQGFTLEPEQGDFILTHPDLRVPSATNEFAINASNGRFWEPAVKRYVGECIAGKTGVRGKDFDMRWTASLVAEAHRILLRGGVSLWPRDTREPSVPGRPHLLYQADPLAFIVEQAGGRASTGHERVLDIVPGELHQRIGFVFGSREEVEHLERYHHDHNLSEYDAPLFGIRGLFRASV